LEYDPYLKQYSILAGGTNVDGRGNIICDTTIPGSQHFLDSARIFSGVVTFSAPAGTYLLRFGNPALQNK
jgi:hypothetical protein